MSVPFDVADACRWTGGERVQGDRGVRFHGVCIDTRVVAAGDLFAAIVGERHDAHDFLESAAEAGAAGLLVARGRKLPDELDPALPVVAVDDTTRALGALAAGHRAGFDGPVVAITGSNGKTSTKEMCAAILSRRAPCLSNEGNLNNQFGLPLTLLRRSESHRTLVVELGMNHRGEIAALAAIAHPTVGVITNVGTAHIEHLGCREEIALEKGDLLAALPPDGVAVVNADDARASAQAGRTRARVVRFGLSAAADVRAEGVEHRGGRRFAFDLVTPDGSTRAEVDGLAEASLQNALAAAAAAMAAGASLSEVVDGLASVPSVRGRLQRYELASGVVVIDDTYNANPQSMELALRILAGHAAGGRAIAVLGSMGELGAESEPAHRETGRLAARLGIDFLFALGEHAGTLVAGAAEAGMPQERLHVGGDHHEIAERVASLARRGDWVLVKGSRSMRMERVVESLCSPEER